MSYIDVSPAPNPCGRPTRFDPETAARIVALVRDGNPRRTAANACAVGLRTVHRWLAHGRSEAPEWAEHRAFRLEYYRAEAEFRSRLVRLVNHAAATDWRAALALLERRDAKNFTRLTRTEALNVHRVEGHVMVHLEQQRSMLADPRVMELQCEMDRIMTQPKAIEV